MSLTTLKAVITELREVVALLEAPFRVNVDESISFSASLSEGDIAEYIWDFGDGERASGVTVNHVWDTEGTYDITLRVTNTLGGHSIETSTVIVDPAVVLPVAEANGPYTGIAGQAVEFTAAGTTGENITEYKWTPGDGGDPVYGLTANYTYASESGSPFTVTLEVTDANTNTDSDQTTAIISPAITNLDPIAVLSNSPTTGTVGISQEYSAQGSNDPDGYIALLNWNWGDGSPEEEGSGYWRRSHTYASADTYTLTLTVTDDLGATDSAQIDVVISAASGTELDWMETPFNQIDNITTDVPIKTGFPQITLGSIKDGSITANQLACFDNAGLRVFSSHLTLGLNTIALNNDFQFMRIISPFVYQGAANPNSFWAGPQFQTSGPITTNTQVFPGHWLYSQGTTTTGDITISQTTIPVNNGNRIRTTNFDAASGLPIILTCLVRVDASGNIQWNEAEFVSVTSTTSNSITVVRGVKSTARAHNRSGGTIRVMTQQSWAADVATYNFSTACPLDGAGNQYCDFAGNWIGTYYNTDASLVPITTTERAEDAITGVLFDSDWGWPSIAWISEAVQDANNNLSIDWTFGEPGTANEGDNIWLDGFLSFQNTLRTTLDARGKTGALFIHGINDTVGFKSSGSQLEAQPSDIFDEAGTLTTNHYDRIHSCIWFAHHTGLAELGPNLTTVFSKKTTGAYPGSTSVTSNADFRLGLAMSCCFGVQYGRINRYSSAPSQARFPWHDEYSVDLTPGATYGNAIQWSGISNYSTLRANTKWLGSPAAGFENGYKRLYDPTGSVWQWANNEITDGDFEAADSVSSNWTGTLCSVTRSTSGPYAGSACMSINPSSVTLSQGNGAIKTNYATGPSVSLTSGQHVTLCFAAKCANPRIFIPEVAGIDFHDIPIPGDNQWHKFVVSAYTSSNTSGPVRFYVGLDDDEVFIDQVFVAKASANLIYREFDNGIAVANMSGAAQTFSSSTRWQKILATGDQSGDTPNDGNLITDAGGGVYTISIPAWDGILMVRPP